MKPAHFPPCVIAITGASGAIYGIKLVSALVRAGKPVYLLISRAGLTTIAEELELSCPLPTGIPPASMDEELVQKLFGSLSSKERRLITYFHEDDFTAPPASGAYPTSGMAVAPCSMKTLAAIRLGYSATLITRAADVTLKERRPLILLPRETPLSSIHLENLLALSRAGAIILPPVPAFYRHPRTIDDLVQYTVERVIQLLDRAVGPANSLNRGDLP